MGLRLCDAAWLLDRSNPRFETVRREAADLAAISAELAPAEPGA
jgi:hypothetical protein